MPVKIIDSDPVDVEISDQTTSPIEWYLSRKLASTTLAIATPITDEGSYLKVTELYTISVASSTGAVANTTWVEIWEGALFMQAQIINVSGTTLTLAKQVGYPFTTNAVVLIVDIDQNKNFLAGGIGKRLRMRYHISQNPETLQVQLYTGQE